jgi:hypothetical protein
MNDRDRATADINRAVTSEDVRHVLGDLDDTIVAEILAVRPTYRDLSEAAIWVRGDSDLTAREHRELGAGALAVAEILVRVEEATVDEHD